MIKCGHTHWSMCTHTHTHHTRTAKDMGRGQPNLTIESRGLDEGSPDPRVGQHDLPHDVVPHSESAQLQPSLTAVGQTRPRQGKDAASTIACQRYLHQEERTHEQHHGGSALLGRKADSHICCCYSATNNQDVRSEILWQKDTNTASRIIITHVKRDSDCHRNEKDNSEKLGGKVNNKIYMQTGGGGGGGG